MNRPVASSRRAAGRPLAALLLAAALAPAWAADVAKQRLVFGAAGAAGENGGDANAQLSFAELSGQPLSVTAGALGGDGGARGDGVFAGHGGTARADAGASGSGRTAARADATGGRGGHAGSADPDAGVGGAGGDGRARAAFEALGSADASAEAAAAGGAGGDGASFGHRAGDGGGATARAEGGGDASRIASTARAVGGAGGNGLRGADGGRGGSADAQTEVVGAASARSIAVLADATGGDAGASEWASGGRAGDATASASVTGHAEVEARARAQAGRASDFRGGQGGLLARAIGSAATTGPQEARSFVTAAGHDGAARWADGEAGGTAEGRSFASSARGDARASLVLTGGNGGDSEAGDGGRGADVVADDRVDGHAGATLVLTQQLRAGSGGRSTQAQGGDGGAGGWADATLNWSGNGPRAVSGSVEVRGGQGGDAYTFHGPPGDGESFGRGGDGGAAQGAVRLSVDGPGSAAHAVVDAHGGGNGIGDGGHGSLGTASGITSARAGRLATARTSARGGAAAFGIDAGDALARADATATEHGGRADAFARADTVGSGRATARADAGAVVGGTAVAHAESGGGTDGNRTAGATATAAGAGGRLTVARAGATGGGGLAEAQVTHGGGIEPVPGGSTDGPRAFSRVDADPSASGVQYALDRVPAVAEALAAAGVGIVSIASIGTMAAADFHGNTYGAPGLDGSTQYRFTLAGAERVVLGFVGFDGRDGGEPIDFSFSVESVGRSLLTHSFTSLSAADAFFQDRVLDLGLFSGAVDLTVRYTFQRAGDQALGLEYLLASGELIPAVPEPADWALWLLGIAVLSWRSRLRRSPRHRGLEDAPA